MAVCFTGAGSQGEWRSWTSEAEYEALQFQQVPPFSEGSRARPGSGMDVSAKRRALELSSKLVP